MFSAAELIDYADGARLACALRIWKSRVVTAERLWRHLMPALCRRVPLNSNGRRAIGCGCVLTL
jgi:hypothetical protein